MKEKKLLKSSGAQKFLGWSGKITSGPEDQNYFLKPRIKKKKKKKKTIKKKKKKKDKSSYLMGILTNFDGARFVRNLIF